MVTETGHYYIVRDDRVLGGEPIIKETRTSVRSVVELWRLGYSPNEVPRELPHPSLAAVFDALSYYSDHQDELQNYVENNRVEELIYPRAKK